jgi:diaminopimelate decarboxylase
VTSVASNPVPGWLRVPDDANALAPLVWPERSHRDGDGRLVVGGVDATTLVARFGSPLYVVDEDDARARASVPPSTSPRRRRAPM